MPRAVYNRVRSGFTELDNFFLEDMDFVRNLSSTSHQNIVAALRQLSIGISADGLIEMLPLSGFLIHECRKRSTAVVVRRFEGEYLRRPTLNDATVVLAREAKLGVSGSFGSLDCSGWKLSCSSVAEQERTNGKSGTSEYRIES